ncbi:hypothetical protein [Paenisporosarcina antarctica]|uniref:Uncharacterized protein n=1 Tax=Paenisporosarcina antarctica TaxID=417367 RepID=A0A4P6ZZ01_9BACL|nr:hypothetical protein [Paenisporosarcina antarctica]QBP41960.1 hypothetical protein E2636_12720 [Paenisporosarcina antarctica]
MEQMEKVIAFLLGVGFNALIIIVLLSLNGKINYHKIRLSILSLISTIIFTIIPTIGYRVDKDLGDYHFGFPAEGLVYRGGLDLTVSSFGLIFNFFFFYWIFKLILVLWKAPTVNN